MPAIPALRHFGADALCLFLLLLPGIALAGPGGTPDQRGEYIFRIAGCGGCHTGKEKSAAALAGGRELKTQFGTFYSPNITPHQEYGIGRWSTEDLALALRQGKSPGNIHLYPVFPYPSYAGMSDEDIRDLMAYLRRVPEYNRRNQPHDLPWYLRIRALLYFWKLLFHSPEPFSPQADKSAQWNRGAYLVNVLGHCGECHTPRNPFGAPDPARYLSGNPDGPEGDPVPNITPHPGDGIGDWSSREIREYLRSGLMPDGDVSGGVMADVIDNSLRYLTNDDLDAMVTYLRSVPGLTKSRR